MLNRHRDPRLLLAACARALRACPGQPSPPPYVGAAKMSSDGVITLQLWSQDGPNIAEAMVRIRPGEPRYEETLRHLGGLKPGEAKAIPPWPTPP